MGIEQDFEQNVAEWKQYCESIAYSSNPNDYVNCEPYRRIVAMGKDALPLIREIYSGPDEDAFFPIFGWTRAIGDIVGDKFEIPEKIRGHVHEIRDFTVAWLDSYLKE